MHGFYRPASPVASISGSSSSSGGEIKRALWVGRTCKALSDVVHREAAAGRIPITLGGDHSIAVGTLQGILRAQPSSVIFWIDAHADINTPVTSPSGNAHGMPLAFLLGLIDASTIPGFEWVQPLLSPSRLIYIALRDLDEGEKRIIRSLGILAFTMHDIDKLGINRVIEEAMVHADPYSVRPLHVSFDIDACDPAFAPATGTPVKGGLSYREAHFILECISATGRLAGLDMVEVNPSLVPGDNSTASLAAELILSCLGKRIL